MVILGSDLNRHVGRFLRALRVFNKDKTFTHACRSCPAVVLNACDIRLKGYLGIMQIENNEPYAFCMCSYILSWRNEVRHLEVKRGMGLVCQAPVNSRQCYLLSLTEAFYISPMPSWVYSRLYKQKQCDEFQKLWPKCTRGEKCTLFIFALTGIHFREKVGVWTGFDVVRGGCEHVVIKLGCILESAFRCPASAVPNASGCFRNSSRVLSGYRLGHLDGQLLCWEEETWRFESTHTLLGSLSLIRRV